MHSPNRYLREISLDERACGINSCFAGSVNKQGDILSFRFCLNGLLLPLYTLAEKKTALSHKCSRAVARSGMSRVPDLATALTHHETSRMPAASTAPPIQKPILSDS